VLDREQECGYACWYGYVVVVIQGRMNGIEHVVYDDQNWQKIKSASGWVAWGGLIGE